MSDTTNTAMIDIPIKGYDVAVDLLNDEYDDIEKLLIDETVPLEHYIKTAVSYYHVDKIEYFQKLLSLVIDDPQLEDRYEQKMLLDGKTEALNILAGYYIEQYNRVRIDQFGNEKQAMEDLCDNKREELLNTINKLLGRAEQFNPSKLSNFLSRGVLHLNLGALDKAESQFDYILTVDKDNVLSRLGMACIKYHKKQYKEALSDFEKCLRMNPQGPADIRLGMGLCHYQMDNFARAKQCFERVLQLDPNNVSALICLSIMDLNSKDEELLQNAVKNYLKKAYTLDSGNSQVLNLLGNHFFFRREVDKTEELVFAAFHNTKSSKIKAESCYNMARAFHHRKDYDSAFKYYYRIVSRLWPEYTLARYGLGQLYIQRNEIDKAIEEFEQILKVEPENLETNLALGNLYAKKRDAKNSLKYLKKVVKKDPENVNALLRIGEYERQNIQHALDNLKEALKVIEEGETELTLTHELYNNIAIHYYKLGKNPEAEDYFKKALTLAECNVLETIDDLQQPIDVKHLSLVYNFARFKEATKSLDVAEKLYLKVAAQHPSYINAYLRLSKIQQKNGDLEKSIHFCKLATSLEPNNPATWAFLGQTHLEQNNFTEAQKAFEYITQNIDKNDIYALLGMGNVYFKSLRVTPKTTTDEKEQERIEKHLDYALLFFEKTLKLDNSNFYAALNGGCVLCENGYTEEGKALILRVREVCIGDDMKETPETYINLGHLAMIQKQYSQAEKYYSACSKRFFNDENNLVLAYLAKAHFDNNKHEESLQILKKIDQTDANNLTIKYNIALALYEKMITVLNESKKDLNKVNILEDQLQHIINLFTDISTKKETTKKSSEFSLPDPIVIHKAKEYITVLETKVREKIEKYKEKAEKEELAKEELKKKQENAFKLIENESKLQNEREEAARREREETLKKNFGRLETIKASLKTNVADDDDEEEEKKTKKRKKNQDAYDDVQGEVENPDQEAAPKKKRKPKEPKKNKEKKDKKDSKKKSRLKKNAKASDEEERDDFEVDSIPQPTSRVVVNDENEEDDYMEEGPSRATADGEEEFSFDNE